MPEPLLTVEDLAEVLRTTPAAIRQRRLRGSPLPRGFKIGRRFLWRPEDVDTWIDSRAERGDIPAEPGSTSELVRQQQSST